MTLGIIAFIVGVCCVFVCEREKERARRRERVREREKERDLFLPYISELCSFLIPDI